MERTRLANLLNERHPLVKLAQQIDWRSFDEHFGTYYSEGTGRPATSTRLMVSLHYLKYTHDLSDEAVLRGWRTLTGSISLGWSSSVTSRL
jgi:transposase, IS5 family